MSIRIEAAASLLHLWRNRTYRSEVSLTEVPLVLSESESESEFESEPELESEFEVLARSRVRWNRCYSPVYRSANRRSSRS